MSKFAEESAVACPTRAVIYTLLRHGRQLDAIEAESQLRKRLGPVLALGRGDALRRAEQDAGI